MSDLSDYKRWNAPSEKQARQAFAALQQRTEAAESRAAQLEAALLTQYAFENRLRLAITGLLLGADATWVEGDQGHDWKEAVTQAQDALQMPTHGVKGLGEIDAQRPKLEAALVKAREALHYFALIPINVRGQDIGVEWRIPSERIREAREALAAIDGLKEPQERAEDK